MNFDFKKYLFTFILLIFLFSNISLADNIDEELSLTNSEIIQASETSTQNSNSKNALKDINSRAYVVIDRNSNTILLGKNEFEKRKMASTTKIMTATVIIEKCNLSDVVTISKKAASVGGSVLGLKKDDKISVKDLLYGLMLRSGNDCAVALAEYTSGSVENFSNLMNEKALELRIRKYTF